MDTLEEGYLSREEGASEAASFFFTDTHAHLTSEPLLSSLPLLLSRAKEAKVNTIINICTDEVSLKAALALRQTLPRLFHAAATTPHDVEKEGAHFFSLVEAAALRGELVALGETGLDYFYEHAPKDAQRAHLLLYLQLAKRTRLPLIFHCRDAFADLFSLTDAHYSSLPALVHCFTGSLDEAKGALDRGWFLSLSGIVTFKKAERIKEIAKYVPLDRLLIETDAPYLAPQSHRGKQNEPSFLPEIAKSLAAIKGIDVSEVAKVTSESARQLFSLPKEIYTPST